MSHIEGKYYDLPTGIFRIDSVTCRTSFKTGVAIIGCCLVLLSMIATICTPALWSNNSAGPLSLFNLVIPQSGVAISPVPQKVLSTNSQRYQQGLWPFLRSWPHQPRSRGSPKASAKNAVEAENTLEAGETMEAMKKKESDPFLVFKIIKAGVSLGYLNPFKAILGRHSSLTIEPNTKIFSLTMKDSLGLKWGYLDDNVFGGSSESFFDPQTGVWSGNVNFPPGFASFRTTLLETPLDLTACSGFKLVVNGQGQRFKFIIKDDDKFNGVSWSYSFNTNQGVDTEVEIKLGDFQPTQDARLVKPAPTLNVASITTIQFIYGKFEFYGEPNPTFKAGNFQLAIKEISTF